RHHWILAAAVERGFDEEERDSNHDRALLKAKRKLWRSYVTDRNKRADRLRIMYRDQYMQWCMESATATRRTFIRPEMIFEPTIPPYPIENMSFVPRSTDWLSEVPTLDDRQPRRAGWMNAAHQHPYNTTFFPCQNNAEFFYPRGTRFVDTYRSVVVDPALQPPELIPDWRTIFDTPSGTPFYTRPVASAGGGAEDSLAPVAPPAARPSPPYEEEKESGGSPSLSLLADAARRLSSS
ncbi:hypothetical protein PPTG_19769, partial [Phytophthora nicotianae INRA-310]